MLHQDLVKRLETLVDREMQKTFNKLTAQMEVALDEHYNPGQFVSYEFLDLREMVMRLMLKKLSEFQL